MPATILLVEDDVDLATVTSDHLRGQGFAVEVAHDGRDGLERARAVDPDLVLLDLTLPELDGLEVCRQLRRGPRHVPLVMLTARDAELDRVVGLELGADDYLTKPFGLAELSARVRALLRRVANLREEVGAGAGALLRHGDLELDGLSRRVARGGQELSLTAREFDLLRLLMSEPGRVFARAELLEQLWGAAYRGYEHTVNSHINRLRSKIEADPSHPEMIVTVWGVGYKFAEASA